MRGFPLLNLIIALLISGAVLLPLVNRATRITAANTPLNATQPVATAQQEETVTTHVSMRFVHAPARITVTAGGKALISHAAGTDSELAFEDTIPMPVTENRTRTELNVTITWPPGTPDSVAELKIEPEAMEARSANVWGSGAAADEWITFSWKGETR